MYTIYLIQIHLHVLLSYYFILLMELVPKPEPLKYFNRNLNFLKTRTGIQPATSKITFFFIYNN